jgi:hypothetical protein
MPVLVRDAPVRLFQAFLRRSSGAALVSSFETASLRAMAFDGRVH